MPVNVKFGASTDNLEAGIKRAQDAVQGFISPVNDLSDSFDKLTGSGSGASNMLALFGGGALIGGIAGLLGFLNKTNLEMLDLEKNARQVGLSIAKFQEVKYATNLSGMDDSAMVSGLQSAAAKLNDLLHGTSDLSKFLDANNVKYKTANGELISMDQYLQDAARLIQNAATEGDKIKIASLLGFTREWVDVLEKGPVALRAMEQAAVAAGAVLDDKVVKKDAEFAERWRASTLEWESYFKTAIVSITPYLDGLIEKAKELPTTLQKAAEWIEQHTPGHGSVNPEDPMGTAAALNYIRGLFGAGGATDTAGLVATRVKTEFDALTASLIATGSATGKGETGAPSGPPTTGLDRAPDRDSDSARVSMEAAEGQIQAANLAYENEIEKLNSALAIHQITEQQKTAATLAAIDVRERADLMALAEASNNDNLSAGQFQRLMDEQTAAEQKADNARTKANDQAIQRYVQDWTAALQPLESGFNSQLHGLLSGTETWGQATKKIFGDVVMAGIEAVEKLVFQWIAGEAAKTTATILGNATRTGVNEAGAAAAIGSKAAEAAATIGIDVGEVFANLAAWLTSTFGPAGIPIALGLAGGVAAVALSQVKHLDVGGYVTSPGLAMIHAGETVLPAQVNTPYQGSPAGGGGVNLNINGSVMGTQAWTNSMVQQLARALASYQSRTPSASFG